MIITPQVGKSESLNIALRAESDSCVNDLKNLKNHVRKLKEEICAVQSIVDSDDLKMCVDALTGKPILVLREEAQKKFEALFYYVQSLKTINEIELLLDTIDDRVPQLTNSQDKEI